MNESTKKVVGLLDKAQAPRAARQRSKPFLISLVITGLMMALGFGTVDGFFTFLKISEPLRQADGTLPLLWGVILFVVSFFIVAGFALAFDYAMEELAPSAWRPLKIVVGILAFVAAFSWSGGSFLSRDVRGIDPDTGLPIQPGEFQAFAIELLDAMSILLLIVFFVLTAIGLKMARDARKELKALQVDADEALVAETAKRKTYALQHKAETTPIILAETLEEEARLISIEVDEAANSKADVIEAYLKGDLARNRDREHFDQAIKGLGNRLSGRSEKISDELQTKIDFILPGDIRLEFLPPADQLSSGMRSKLRSMASYLRKRYEKGIIYKELMA